MPTYTLEQVKEAFWKTFKGAGELWLGDSERYPEEAEDLVGHEWKDFLENLEKKPNYFCLACRREHLPEIACSNVPDKCKDCGSEIPFLSAWTADDSPLCHLCFNKRLRK